MHCLIDHDLNERGTVFAAINGKRITLNTQLIMVERSENQTASEVHLNKPESFKTYPTHRVCAIIETKADAKHAVDGLLDLKIEPSAIDIFHGSEGVDILDAEGTHHGPMVALTRTLQQAGDVETDAFKVYESALEKEYFVFSVEVSTPEIKEAVATILTNNHAEFVNYFGSWTVEAL